MSAQIKRSQFLMNLLASDLLDNLPGLFALYEAAFNEKREIGCAFVMV